MYPHYLYESFLKRLKNDGVLLAAVSRNSPDDAMACLSAHSMVLHPDDFITVVANYSAKSAQIRVIADQLDLGLDAFVFIDDDPVERAEVSAALPAITKFGFSRVRGRSARTFYINGPVLSPRPGDSGRQSAHGVLPASAENHAAIGGSWR